MVGLFSEGVEAALRAAFDAHEGQTRKSDPVPYVTHPVHVALLLARAGADDVTIQAALLHDVVEDCDDWTEERVWREFGPDVASVVAELTEPSGTWEERKQATFDKVKSLTLRALVVKSADKLHNMRSLAAKLDAAEDASAVWASFSRGPSDTIENARRLVGALRDRLDAVNGFDALSIDLQRALRAFERHDEA
ncbi:MAG: HD domain-containing protein [Planctomycetota bacterium]